MFQEPGHSQGAKAAASSGARLLTGDLEALAVRLQLIAGAKSALDLQYYYWLPDLAGRLMALAVIRAADRGVKVRLLLDDLNATVHDRSLAALEAHPNISVRLFNPLRFRRNRFLRVMAFLATFITANRRMHNKCMVVDGSIAIVGGRNIGDPYFGIDDGTNFHDLDMLLSGRATAEAARVFDAYWNALASRRVSHLIGKGSNKLEKLRRRLEQEAGSRRALKLLRKIDTDVPPVEFENLRSVSALRVRADPPEKAALAKTSNWLGARIEALIASAKTDLQILSPYFIPGLWGCELLEEAAARGVKVRILTNCLAATDVVVAHSGYARYRNRLLAAGIELFEQPAKHRRGRARLFGSRKASLHTKAILVDGNRGFVGSFNFDPRSKSINTEMGVFFKDDRLGEEMSQELREHLKHCLYVAKEGKALVWRNRAGRVISRHTEPFASLQRRVMAAIAGLFPIESQL